MTDSDAIELARYQGGTEEDAERAVMNFRYALDDIEDVVKTREGMKLIRGEIEGWRQRIASIILQV
jgi:hypothetical protein